MIQNRIIKNSINFNFVALDIKTLPSHIRTFRTWADKKVWRFNPGSTATIPGSHPYE